jgi:predicted membrane channel-forming protein YqfA (hemolysin III family)
MYVGAVLAVLQAIVGIVPLAGGAALLGQPVSSASDVSYVRGQLISYVVVALISMALWLWLAWASKRGRSWSRIVSAVVFALATGVLVVSLIAPANHAGRIIFLASWVVGLLAVVSQWQRSSSEYYRARSRPVSQ